MPDFFEQPILNSPYDYPSSHWALDEFGQPTQETVESRRSVSFITPIPKPKKQMKKEAQAALVMDEGKGISTEDQQYDPTGMINEVRRRVDLWRKIPDPNAWNVTPETARLLQHWRDHKFTGLRPFFCQIEAAETIIWLTEVAPKIGKDGQVFLDHLDAVNGEASPDLARLALKLATGAGKTAVMAMIIAWQTVNAVRRPTSKNYTRGFLIVTPGITIRDRLRVLQPNDPNEYYGSRELVPQDMLPDIMRATVIITNYHSFKLREAIDISKGGRSLLQGRGEAIQTLETEGQMLQRVMPALMGMKGVMVINDEAHHCYREKPPSEDDAALKGEEKKEADDNSEAARVWLTGIEMVNRTIGVRRVVDLSATPFFLKGSGYAEGTLFPWTMSDFSLMDAIECGIVKLPRVPIADNIPGEEMPKFRNLWEHIGKKLPKRVSAKPGELDPLALPVELQTALEALYGHYEKQFDLWENAGINVPPCFIVVCQNVAISKLVYDYISGFEVESEDGSTVVQNGRLKLFRNYDEHKNKLATPRTLLIDSRQIESGDALDKNFRDAAADEIERFRGQIVARTGDQRAGDNISDQDLLREIMNTVGKEGQLGASIRCVVSVSMLTEGWDAQTVTHVLGVRAFGTQLLCEQVIGRALRRQSYELNDEGLFDVEYADVLGIPFDFTAKPVVAPPQPPRETVQVRAVMPERDDCEITFPRVGGYRVVLPEDRLVADFNDDSTLILTPDLVGPTVTRSQGIIGTGADLHLERLKDTRQSTIVFELTNRLVTTKLRDAGGIPMVSQFGNARPIVRQWLNDHLVCKGGTYPAQLIYQELADMACERIYQGIVKELYGEKSIKAVLDPYNPAGSSRFVNFTTSRKLRWETAADSCQLNWAICDSEWEMELCRVLESHPRVRSYVRNQNLGFEVPYRSASTQRRYLPDFIVNVDDGHGDDDLLHLIIEVKGFRGEDAKDKKNTMDAFWIPGVNNLGGFGRWAFAEFTDVYTMGDELDEKITESIDAAIDDAIATDQAAPAPATS